MPVARARQLCPHGVFVPGRMERYAEVSRQIMAILRDYSPLVEQASVDEAYLDIGGAERLFGPPRQLALRVKADIRSGTGLACSVGIAPVKFLAKIASDWRKPDGLFILEDADVPAFLAALPVGKIPGVGKKGEAQLEGFGVRTCADVLRYPRDFWQRRFGKWGEFLFDRARGVDTRGLETSYEAKSESAENTFSRDTDDKEELKRWLLHQSERVGRSLRQAGLKGRTVTLKLKYSDFKQITRSRTLRESTNATQTIFETAAALLDELPLERTARLVGVGVSHFARGQEQALLLRDEALGRRDDLDRALDAIKERYGRDAIVRGRVFGFLRREEDE